MDGSKGLIEKLRSQLTLSGRTYEDVALSCEMSTHAVFDILHGKTDPKLSRIIRICDALGLTIDIKED